MQNEKPQETFTQDHMNNEVMSTLRKALPVSFNGFVTGIYVTPEIAETFLKYNTKNRHISDAVNLRYAQAMQAGHWKFNGAPIVFSNRGRLLDGQNRLKAVARSGVTIPMLVVYGIDEENFNTMDQGSKRTTVQILRILKCKDSNTLAAALRLAYIYLYVDSKMGQFGTDTVYNDVLLNLLVRYPNIKNSVSKANPARHLCNSTIVAFCHFVFSLKAPQSADLFISQFTTGEDLHSGHPALVLRNFLIESKGEIPKLNSRTIIALFFKAWNHFRKGEKIKALKWRGTDVFPEVI